jgi:hypothetical protein
MKRKLMGAGILFLVLIFLMVSCASTDPVEEPVSTTPATSTPETPVEQPPSSETPVAQTPTPATVSQTEIDALNAARSLADTNRALALEVESPAYLPSDWNAVESRYVRENGSVSSIEKTPAAYQTATANYNGIAADFEKVALGALPMYAEDFRDKTVAERNAAIEAGILDIDPERFAVADDYALSALAAWEIKDYETAVISARNALPRYTALKTAAQAYNVRMEIADQRFVAYDNTAIDAADTTALRAVDQYDAGDIAGLSNAEKALSSYNSINEALGTGAEAYDARMNLANHRFMSYDTTAIDAADGTALKALNQYDVGNVDAAVADANKALSEYNKIQTALDSADRAYDIRMNIADHKFASYDNTAIDAADATAYQALNQYDAGNVDAAIASADEAISEYTTIYTTLSTASAAYDARMDIQYWVDMAIQYEAYNARMGIYYGDYSAYETALNAADADAYRAINQYDNGNADAALVSAREALSGYNTLRSTALVDATTRVEDFAGDSQRAAVAAKAPVAAKPEYDRANTVYRNGQRQLSAKNYEGAAVAYYDSVALFNEATDRAEYKRRQAQSAIDEAARRIAESDQTAADAEVRIEGGAL